MGIGKRLRGFALVLCLLFLAFSSFSSVAFSGNHSLVVGEFNKTFLFFPSLQVESSPGLKPGTRVLCERVHIDGLSRFSNLKKFAHSIKVKVSHGDSSLRRPNLEVCFHRNASLGIGMCPQGKWQKVSKGSWVTPMSPFDHKLLDIRLIGSSQEMLEVSIEEEFFLYRIIFLISGIVLLSLASSLSQSLVFYYSSAMAVGVILVILIVLFQLGLGTFLLGYVPRLLHSLLSELGISEDMYNPLAIFLLGFVVLAGAWLGFWVVRKLVLAEDGSIDISTSLFVAWSIRIVAVIMILQSSLDPILAAEALISGLMLSSLLRKVTRLRFLRRTCKKLFKFVKNIGSKTRIPDLLPDQDSYDEYIYKRPKNSNCLKRQSRRFPLASCNTSIQGLNRTSPSQLSDEDSFLSTFHNTPERKKFTKAEWEKFTKDSTQKALDELVSSPDFSKWVASNADRITVTPSTSSASNSARRRRWFLWS
ncbi:hypothetical protein COLO4_11588 [Corchorus olitorius]|uniref:Transmembrane protein 194 n=1 Tax=Corchorus olitorius TaxID=93759 RepID=A0A1R3K404_9ROSI|nr:hypothetical protein COLO4_11588 [Corchorus olitorius]